MVATMRSLASLFPLLLLTAAACVPQPAEAPEPEPAPTPKGPARPAEQTPELDASLQGFLRAESVTGVVALFDSADEKLRCSDLARCKKGYLPASTFKIAHTLIGVEEGKIESAETPFKWDGIEYTVQDWNQDHTLRTAMQVSCVPCYQSLARSIGEEKEKAWLAKLGYGNAQVTGGVDKFWLEGGLRITPIEQIDFVWRLDHGELPVSEKARGITLDVLTVSQNDSYTLRAKTGRACDPDTGWYVGYLESGERKVFFAVTIDGLDSGADPAVDLGSARTSVALAALRSATGLRID